MKTLSITLIASTVGLALAAAPAEAAKKGKKKSVHVSQLQRQTPAGTAAYRDGGVRRGPLYNGADYIGDDPDPAIRAYLMKDMTRYQGSY